MLNAHLTGAIYPNCLEYKQLFERCSYVCHIHVYCTHILSTIVREQFHIFLFRPYIWVCLFGGYPFFGGFTGKQKGKPLCWRVPPPSTFSVPVFCQARERQTSLSWILSSSLCEKPASPSDIDSREYNGSLNQPNFAFVPCLLNWAVLKSPAKRLTLSGSNGNLTKHYKAKELRALRGCWEPPSYMAARGGWLSKVRCC